MLAFYEGLETNLKAYEAKDKETVDYLYSMVDFQKFKVKMCTSKAIVMKEKNMQSERLSSDQIVKMSDINLKQEQEYYSKLMGEDAASGACGWKKRLDVSKWTDDLKMKVYSRQQETTKNDLFRMEIKFRNRKVKELNEFFMNLPVEKFSMMVEVKYTDMTTNEAEGTASLIRYQRTTAPLVNDRDTVVGIWVK